MAAGDFFCTPLTGPVDNNLYTTDVNATFVNAAAGDFRIKSASPAIDTGVAIAEVTTDIIGTFRPQGPAFDIGAFEYCASGSCGGTTPPPPPVTSLAFNAGGAAFTASDGTQYLADQYVSGGSTYSTTDPIAGTTDDPLYQSERYGTFSYALPLANGAYDVTLQFAEIYHTAPGQRQFDVSLEGTPVISNLDLYQTAGHDTAKDYTFPVTLTDGTLTITFSTDVDHAKVSAIRVVPRGAAVPGDLTGDGQVTLADLRLLIQMLVGQTAPTEAAKALAAPTEQLTLADLRALIQLLVAP
jgi:hypothetical protein